MMFPIHPSRIITIASLKYLFDLQVHHVVGLSLLSLLLFHVIIPSLSEIRYVSKICLLGLSIILIIKTGTWIIKIHRKVSNPPDFRIKMLNYLLPLYEDPNLYEFREMFPRWCKRVRRCQKVSHYQDYTPKPSDTNRTIVFPKNYYCNRKTYNGEFTNIGGKLIQITLCDACKAAKRILHKAYHVGDYWPKNQYLIPQNDDKPECLEYLSAYYQATEYALREKFTRTFSLPRNKGHEDWLKTLKFQHLYLIINGRLVNRKDHEKTVTLNRNRAYDEEIIICNDDESRINLMLKPVIENLRNPPPKPTIITCNTEHNITDDWDDSITIHQPKNQPPPNHTPDWDEEE